MHPINRRTVCLAAAVLPFSLHAAKSREPGVHDNKVVFGQTLGYDSVWGSLYKNYSDGMLAVFAEQNARGGVHGRKIELVRKEDNYVTDKAVANIREFGTSGDVFGLACIGGTGITIAAIPLLEEFGLPTVGTLTGSQAVRKFSRFLFHTRTGYSTEVEKMVEHLTTLGIVRVAVVLQDNAFGKGNLEAATNAIKLKKRELVATVAHGTEKWDAAEMAAVLAKANPQAVLLFSPPSTVADVMKAYKEKTNAPLPSPWVLSVTSAPKLYELAGPMIRGMAVTQVMPHPLSGSSQLTRDFRNTTNRYGRKDNMTYEAVEGYLTGRVIVEALRRSGRNLTRGGYVQALESFGDLKFNDVPVRYTNDSHLGPSFVEATLLSETGTVLR